jgi:hypothetical protein
MTFAVREDVISHPAGVAPARRSEMVPHVRMDKEDWRAEVDELASVGHVSMWKMNGTPLVQRVC